MSALSAGGLTLRGIADMKHRNQVGAWDQAEFITSTAKIERTCIDPSEFNGGVFLSTLLISSIYLLSSLKTRTRFSDDQ